jgi:serine/threonine-protein kinase
LTDLQSSLAAALQDRYRLERELGRGGMAVVYLAEDLRHERPVALKVLLPELAAALGPERFQREIKLAARLQHPHILGVHDSGEAAGRLWFAMPFVEGESLRDRLRRERQLAVDDALRIGREAAAALDYAHRHGVIHRDIKPENILLTADGDTLVADFGIARALAGDEEHLTQTGLSVGTPAYMSPEQASGDKALDARTDIYSLAAVVYEMLAGEAPFTGPSAQAVAMKRLTEAPPSVRRGRPTVPEAVDEAIRRALAPLPADRFATAGEFGRALQPAASTTGATTAATAAAPPTPVPASATPAAATVVTSPPPTAPVQTPRRRVPVAALALGLGFVLGLGVLFAWRRSHADNAESTGARVLAVLPFENLGDSADAYFADGVTDEVRGKLARLGGLSVIARNSSTGYRNTKKLPEEIARELGADYLLTATVRWSKAPGQPNRVRVTPELVDVRPGHAARTQWQDAFDAALTDVFQVQADIAGKVASALDVTLGDSARRELAARPTANLDAYDAYLKGLASRGNAPAIIRRAIGFYEQAVALDSTFLAAWARLARARSQLYAQSTPTPALAAAALQALERARALGPDRPETYAAIRSYSANVLADPAKASAAAEAALARAPNDADILGNLAVIEQTLGQWDSSLAHCRRAAILDPRSVSVRGNLGITLLALRRYEEAAAELDQALELAPGDLGILQYRAMVDLARGDLAGAQATIDRAESTVPPAVVAPFFALYQDLYWVLDGAQQDLVLKSTPSAFDGDRLGWALALAETYHLQGRLQPARAYADTAQADAAAQLKATPGDAQRHALRGVALAYAGRKAEAIAEGKRGVELMPMSRDATTAPYVLLQLARTYILVGEPERALDALEPLLRMPFYLSPGWLRIDPNFVPLKGNPRFEKLAAGG